MLVVSNCHYIRESFDSKYPSIFGLTPKQFEDQLIELSKHGTFISQSELLNFLDKPFDKNYILITFDDGLSEQFELARPILKKLGIPFVFFINSMNYVEKKVSLVHKIHIVRSEISSEEIINFIKKDLNIGLNKKEKSLAKVNYNYDDEISANLKYLLNFKLNLFEQEQVMNPLFASIRNEEQVNKELYFTEEQLNILYAEGSLGSHSHHHIPLGRYDEKEIELEYIKVQNFFKSRFGKETYSISYPYGSYEACAKVSNIAKKYNFKLGFSMERAASLSLDNNPLMISRFDCNDLPKGKFSLFNSKKCLFDNINLSEWYQKVN
tara:strand:- start:49 stop:1017 length:969 start_codon:yes stop_codon:yes gene_type:complete